LKNGTPNRHRIAGQMVKDMLDESSFEASPGSAVPGPVAKAARAVADRLSGNDE
jgi:pyruvate dehydrogenase (quinone)